MFVALAGLPLPDADSPLGADEGVGAGCALPADDDPADDDPAVASAEEEDDEAAGLVSRGGSSFEPEPELTGGVGLEAGASAFAAASLPPLLAAPGLRVSRGRAATASNPAGTGPAFATASLSFSRSSGVPGRHAPVAIHGTGAFAALLCSAV